MSSRNSRRLGKEGSGFFAISPAQMVSSTNVAVSGPARSQDIWKPDFTKYPTLSDGKKKVESDLFAYVGREKRVKESSDENSKATIPSERSNASMPSDIEMKKLPYGRLFTEPWKYVKNTVPDNLARPIRKTERTKAPSRKRGEEDDWIPGHAAEDLSSFSFQMDEETAAKYKQEDKVTLNKHVSLFDQHLPPKPKRASNVLSAFPVSMKTPVVTPPMLAKTSFARQGLNVRVDFGKMTLPPQMSEKFICQLFVFDADPQAPFKMSETYTFIAHDGKTGQVPPASCLFRIEQPRISVALVAVLYHIIRGEYDDGVDPYAKALSKKDLAKWTEAVKDATARLDGNYQYFAVGAHMLFAKECELAAHGMVHMDNFTKIKSKISKIIPTLFSDKTKSKVLQCALDFKIEMVKMEDLKTVNLLDDRLLPVDLDPDKIIDLEDDDRKKERKCTEIVLEQHLFPSPEDVVVPYTEYVNTMWLYPDSLDFSNCKSADSSARNIVAVLKVLPDDKDIKAKGLPVMYDSVQHRFVTEAVLPVQYHHKMVVFNAYEEVKIAIPSVVTTTTHILVTFYHLECKVLKSGKDVNHRKLIGYCVIPFCAKNGVFVPEMKSSAPCFFTQMPGGYLAAIENGTHDIKWIDNGKQLFHFQTKADSSVFPSDAAIATFLKLDPKEVHRMIESEAAGAAGAPLTPQSPQNPQSPRSPVGDPPKPVAESSSSSRFSFRKSSASPEISRSDSPALASSQHSYLDRVLTIINNLNEKDPKRKKECAMHKVRFALNLIQKLMVFVTFDEPAIAEAAFIQLLMVLEAIEGEARTKAVQEPILESISCYMLPDVDPFCDTLHECIVKQWLSVLRNKKVNGVSLDSFTVDEDDDKKALRLSLQYSWFLYTIVIRSMTQELPKLHKNSPDDKLQTFSPAFVNLLKVLNQTVASTSVFFAKNVMLTREVNLATVFFFSNLLDLLDCNIVFEWIFDFITHLNGSTHLDLQDQKFMALRILFENKHVIEMNHPIAHESFSPKSTEPLEHELFQRHFLTGLLMQEVRHALNGNEQPLRVLALETLLTILQETEINIDKADIKHMKPDDLRNSFACMFFPFILSTIDHATILLRDVALLNASANESKRMTTVQPTAQMKDAKECGIWLACFVHILQRCSHVDGGKFLLAWWNSEVPKRHVRFLDILAAIPDVFKYPGKVDALPYDYAFGTPESAQPNPSTSPLAEITNTASFTGIEEKPSRKSFRSQVNLTSTGRRQRPQIIRGHGDLNVKTYMEDHYANLSVISKTDRAPVITPMVCGLVYPKRWGLLPPYESPARDFVIQMYQTLSLESSSIVLEVATLFTTELSGVLAKPRSKQTSHSSSSASQKDDVTYSEELEKFFAVFIALISKSQCDEFLLVLFSSLQFLMLRFRKQVFRDHTPYCQELTKAVFRMADSKNPSVRGMCAAMLCNMIKFNTDEMSNQRSTSSSTDKFSRMKLTSTVAVSEIVADPDRDDDLSFLTQMLDAVTKYLSHTDMKKDITDLQSRLVKVINDGIEMQKYKNDPETTAELYHSISMGFLESPDLRLTWLSSLAKRHEANRNKEQAAQTKIVMAALVVKYMQLTRSFPMTLNEDEWAHVCPQIKGELEVPKKQALLAVKDEICTGPLFSEKGFAMLLKDAVELLRSSANYEQCVEALQLLLQLPRATHDYAEQSKIYAELQKLCDKIVAESSQTARVDPNYYRVAFFGKAFGKLDGRQFVYKESAFVRLADFTTRFNEQYKDIQFTYLPNMSVVDPAKLEKDKNFIQVGAVQPYFADDDSKTLVDSGSSNPSSNNVAYTNAIREFVMSMPFTKSGKAQGDVGDQWLKKINLRTNGAFPYMLKRLCVSKQVQNDVPPVRNAIDMISGRVLALQMELDGKTINTKTLLSLLHGALLAAVNVGPLAVARVFLEKESRAKLDPKPTTADIQELSMLMGKLDSTLNTALSAIECEIDQEQKPLLDELWNAHKIFSEQVSTICANAQ